MSTLKKSILGVVCGLLLTVAILFLGTQLAKIGEELAAEKEASRHASEIILNHGNGISTSYTGVRDVRGGIGWLTFTDSKGRRIEYRGSFTVIR